MSKIQHSRRDFLKQSGALSATAWLGAPLVANLMAMSEAAAASASDYRALVCVYLAGGNDGLSMVIPDNDATWNHYTKVRKPLTYSRPQYLSLTHTPDDGSPAKRYLLHPRMSAVAALYGNKKLAVIGNVGPLQAPTKRDAQGEAGALYKNTPKPPKLFSHNDQTSIWQTGQIDGATNGWAGEALVAATALTANATTGLDNNALASIGVGSAPALLAASGLKPYGIGTTGALPLSSGYEKTKRDDGSFVQNKLFNYFGTDRLDQAWSGAYKSSKLTYDPAAADPALTHELEKDHTKVVIQSQKVWKTLSQVNLAPLPAATDPALKPRNALESQFAVVAGLIKASNQGPLAMKRQVFFVQLGGFDTHAGQMSEEYGHPQLMETLSEGLDYFDRLLDSDRSKVTTFTASDFGRKLHPNGGGTDHGWGSHHLVMGGAVKGGKVYGHFPSFSANYGMERFNADGSLESQDVLSYNDPQMLDDGTMIPVVPITSYLKPMATWFGVTDFAALWKKLDAGLNLNQGFPEVPFI